ncbi:extensin-like [Pyrus ussuriensis x Pyrus communis]|uniref:Extensin-like n=1 Tax=Pyrus ussuriensis x Pyrus communis TaxID=2448454 RepID=A0A5N5HW37_9ROSA|nr:extensin-like [Pyrus ussuriensis x Pyrus communis]
MHPWVHDGSNLQEPEYFLGGISSENGSSYGGGEHTSSGYDAMMNYTGLSASHTINTSQRDLGAELLEAEVEEGQFAGEAKGGGDGGLGAFDALLEVKV